MVGVLLRVSLVALLIYGGLLYLTYWSFTHIPTGFIPEQDKGYLLVNVQLARLGVRAAHPASHGPARNAWPVRRRAWSTPWGSPDSRWC